MKKLLYLLGLICNCILANQKVQVFDTNIENSLLIDSLLNCCKSYMYYEYERANMNEKFFCFLQVFTRRDQNREYYLTVYDAWGNKDFYEIEENGRLFFYDFNLFFYEFDSMSVLIGMEKPECELQNKDSINIITKRDAEIYLQVSFVGTENGCKIISYDNFKAITDPDEYRSFSFENDTFFTYGINNDYPFENPYERDTSVVYLDREESIN